MLVQKALSILKVLLTIYFKNITKHFYRLATKNWWLSDIKTLNLSHIYKLAATFKDDRQTDNETTNGKKTNSLPDKKSIHNVGTSCFSK